VDLLSFFLLETFLPHNKSFFTKKTVEISVLNFVSKLSDPNILPDSSVCLLHGEGESAFLHPSVHEKMMLVWRLEKGCQALQLFAARSGTLGRTLGLVCHTP